MQIINHCNKLVFSYVNGVTIAIGHEVLRLTFVAHRDWARKNAPARLWGGVGVVNEEYGNAVQILLPSGSTAIGYACRPLSVLGMHGRTVAESQAMELLASGVPDEKIFCVEFFAVNGRSLDMDRVLVVHPHGWNGWDENHFASRGEYSLTVR